MNLNPDDVGYDHSMIESCSKKRMIIAIAVLGGLSILIIILESQHLHTPDEDVHDHHPILKEKLTSEDKCWKTEEYEIIKPCDLCTADEIFNHTPVVCVAKGYKELVRCLNKEKNVYRSCNQVNWVEERRFWKFEASFAILGFFSGIAVFVRHKQLDHRMYQRIQKQIAAGV